MFDLGWQEFILIALVAVVVVGPKDLPRVIRSVGQWIRKARSLASEFQGSLEEMAREAELDDVRKQIQQVSRDGVGGSIEKHVDPGGDIRRSFEDARASSGADEIQGALDEAKRDTQALATARDDTTTGSKGAAKVDPTTGETVGSYEALAAKTRIPDNSVTPPAEPSGAEPAAAKPSGRKPATAKAGAAKAGTGNSGTAKSGNAASGNAQPGNTQSGNAKAGNAKSGTAKAPARRAAAKTSAASSKSDAKPKRAARKPAATDAGEA